MSKTKIAIISTVVGILAIIAILFGVVFCLRREEVVVVGNEANIEISSDAIINSAGLKHGTSIFMLDKDTAINNIEKEFPYIKVIQIKTVSVIKVEIHVRSRVETFYVQNQNKYYILDEELKVLRILETGIDENIEETLNNLIVLNLSDLGITSNTVAADFLSTEYYRQVINDLYGALYSTAMLDLDSDGQTEYLSRADIIDVIDSVEFDVGYSLDEAYTRVILNLNNGFKIDIGKPEENLSYKVNVCFSAYNKLSEEQKATGSIKYYYTAEGEAKAGYFAE
ncbi:MAG TPA: FtsQ-type POTRA domain-containing protein [Candidatus Onthoplasma faecipullorum]|nr:FtsQ-type POTRA domain-containing protein [Candidatus Onthoplasma faecipullorum]